ncbi:MAG: beta-propeller fold lactonase family protein [Xanthobacteraceae bacterium]
MTKTVYYAAIGPELGVFDVDVDAVTLTRHGAVTLPANIQYAWPHPSRRNLYVASSNGGPRAVGDRHFASALAIDPATGSLRPHGEAAALPSRPIHLSVDRNGEYLLTAYNNPSHITVHHLNADGSISAPVAQPEILDTGIYAHQVLTAPSNRMVTLVARGNDAEPGKAEDPGALKTFAFEDGVLRNLASITPGTGMGFGPRHLDFHPTKPWVFVSIERQNKLYVYELDAESGLKREPLFVKDTLSKTPAMRQAAGAIHVHPSGKFVYVTNRASDLSSFGGKPAVVGGQNDIAVFSIDLKTAEPTLIQNADARSIELRTFGIDPSGRMLVAASIAPAPVREGERIVTIPAALTVFRIGDDGKLAFVRKYDIDTGAQRQFWTGMVTEP